MTSHDMVLREVRIPGSDQIVDVEIRAGGVASITAHATDPHLGIQHYPADGRYLLPGLWDNHVHFGQWVTQQQRLELMHTTSADEVLGLVRRHVTGDPQATLIGYGFRDGLWQSPPTREALDRVAGAQPVVLISADLHCAWLNTAAQSMLSVRSGEDGLVREAEWFAALERLEDPADLSSLQYQKVATAAAQRGVVGVVEFENTDNLTAWPQRSDDGVDALRVEISAWPEHLGAVIAAGIKTGDVLDARGLITMGPLKVVVDGSLNTRTAWCWDPYPGLDPLAPHACGLETVPIDQVEQLMRAARDAGISAAIHAIGDRANTAVLDLFEALSMGGVIEHAQLLRDTDIPRFASLGLSASVQPEHAMDDRDVAEAYWAGRTHRAFALRSLWESGASLHLGSDAPVSPLDPWLGLATAVTRTRDGRDPWHPEQAVPVEVALAASARGRSQVRTGDVADLILVDRDPYLSSAEELRTMPVAATVLGGRFTWNAL